MATKIYLPSSGSPDVTPSSWVFTNQGASAVTYKGVTTKISSAFTSVTEGTGTTSPYTEAVLRYVIGPLDAQSISGTVRMVMRVSESNAGANANLRMAAKIIQSSGADRATLLAETGSDAASSPYEMTTTLATKLCYTVSETEPLSLTTQSASAGDYLVIEIGHRSATTTNRTITYRIGDNSASDCPYSADDTNEYCPWVEFSLTLSFQAAPTTVSLTNAAATVAGQVLTLAPGEAIVAESAAAVSLAGQVLTLAPGEAIIAAATGGMTMAGQTISVDAPMGGVTIELQPG